MIEQIAKDYNVTIVQIEPGDKYCIANGLDMYLNRSWLIGNDEIQLGIYENPELKLLSLLHEIGHILDKSYRPEYTEYDYEQNAWNVAYILANKYKIIFSDEAKQWAEEQLNTYKHINIMTLNDVKKDLYKSKVNAKFSHYCAGKLYYTVELQNGEIYQFPINTTEQIQLIIACESDPGEIEVNNMVYSDKTTISELSSDLGQTPFHAEIKASELNRWIAKAFDNSEFICINKAPVLENEQIIGTL